MFNLIQIFLFCLVLGVLPIYSLISTLDISFRKKVGISFGFAPVLIALYNIIIVALDIESSWAKYFILIIPLFSFFKFKGVGVLKNRSNIYFLVASLVVGVVFSLLIFPDTFSVQQMLYADVEYNLGFVQELKYHFPPKDPHWSVDGLLFYHYLGNMFLASVSNFSGISVLETYNYANIYLSISLFFVIGAISTRRNLVPTILIALIYFLFSFTNEWVLFSSFHAHISKSASTFLWALPTFFASYILWKEFDKNRERNLVFLFGAGLLITTSLVFFKNTLIFVFLFLELFSFCRFLVKNNVIKIFSDKSQIKIFTTYLFIPMITVLLLLLLRDGNFIGLYLGLESRDFAFFESWNIFSVISVCFLPVIIFLILSKFKVTDGGQLIFAAVINLILFLVLLHAGHSDVYFGFNSLLVVLIIFLETSTGFKFIKYVFSYFISYLILSVVFEKTVLINNPFELDKKSFSNQTDVSDSLFYKKVKEFEYLGSQLDDNTLLAVKYYGDKQFKFSAFMGVRTWNECNSYEFSTINNYIPIAAFQEQQSFIPSYFEEKPTIESYNSAYNEFKLSFEIDTNKYENPEIRRKIYKGLIFGNWDFKKRMQVLKETGITHIQVDRGDLEEVNNWIKSLEKIEGKTVNIYSCY